MAFTKTPTSDTYSSQRLPAAYPIDARTFESNSFSKDSGMLNLVPLKVDDRVEAQTRPAFMGFNMINETNGLIITGTFHGGYVWSPDTDPTVGAYYFAVVDTTVWTSRTGRTWFPLITGLTSFTAYTDLNCGFTEYIYSTGIKRLILLTGRQGFVFIDDTAYTQITDADFPQYHVPTPVFINGYLFVAARNSGDIYNCVLDNPLSWTAGSFISSEMYPDNIKAIVKVNNYLLAISSQGCEYFQDVANATASPLARYEGSALPFGCAYATTIAANKNTVVFLANPNDGEGSLKVLENFQYKDIPCSWLLQALKANAYDTVGQTNLTNLYGFLLRKNDQLYYVIQTGDVQTNEEKPMFAYCFSTGMWVEWSSDMFITCATSDFFRSANYIFGSVRGSSPATRYPFCAVFGSPQHYSFGSTSPFKVDLLSWTSSTDQLLSTPTAGDGWVVNNNIETEIRTPEISFGTLNTKTNSRFGIGVTTNATTTLYLTLSYTNCDGNDTPTTTTIDVNPNNNFPFTTRLGQFRQRQYKVSYTGPYFIRYRFFEVDINKGQQ